jgi:pilus assembly protein FimV
MARQMNIPATFLQRAITPMIVCMGLTFAGMNVSQAAQTGHGRVNSVAGAPLQLSIPIRGLTTDDLNVLSASVAESAAWAQAGLTLPASVESLSVTIEPGVNATSRNLVLRSTQAVNRPVIDVLIRLTTASGTTSIQSSYLVLVGDALPKSAGVVQVVRGDTLYAISLEKSVSGADIYQVMWAIYTANPQAFIANNMNLLRAGVSLNIPDAATMRAVDAKYARSMFAQHDQAFRSRRGPGQTGVTVPTVPTVVTPSAQTGAITSPQSAPDNAAVGDQVRLASTNPSDQQADALVAKANELREMQSRIEALQKNVEDLKDALQKSQAATGSSGITGPVGASGSSGSVGATGTPGSPGASGVPGISGTAGTSAAPGTLKTEGSSANGAKTNPETVAAREVKTGMDKLKQYASDHVLGVVLGISALLALIIAFLLKRAGRQARNDDLDQVPHANASVASDFDQKLQSIDLNLSADDKPSNTAGSSKTGV